MQKQLAILGIAAGLYGSGGVLQAGDVTGSVGIVVGSGGGGLVVGAVRPKPVVVLPPKGAPLVVRSVPVCRVVPVPPVVAACPPHRPVVLHHGLRRLVPVKMVPVREPTPRRRHGRQAMWVWGH